MNCLSKSPAEWDADTIGHEEWVERIVLWMLTASPNATVEAMGWPPIASVHKQVSLGASRADVVVLHHDGSVSLIEAKAAGRLRDQCQAIGQLAYQAIMAASVFQTATVRRVVAVPTPVSTDLMLALVESNTDLFAVPSKADVAAWPPGNNQDNQDDSARG